MLPKVPQMTDALTVKFSTSAVKIPLRGAKPLGKKPSGEDDSRREVTDRLATRTPQGTTSRRLRRRPEVFRRGIERLAEFAQPFTACLVRQEQRDHAPTYLARLVSDLERKHTGAIAYPYDQRHGVQHSSAPLPETIVP